MTLMETTVPQLLQTIFTGAGASALGATGFGFATGFGAGAATGAGAGTGAATGAATTGADAAGAISTTGAATVSLAFSSKQPLKVNKLINANVAKTILRVDDFKKIPLNKLVW
jgi:hypothetical protein